MDSLEASREFLKADMWELWDRLETDQRKGMPPPPPQKPCPAEGTLVDLVAPEAMAVGQLPLIEAIGRRRSRRRYAPQPLTLEELSFLLWATQGLSIRPAERGADLREAIGAPRTVPSGGGRHPFETYLLVSRVEGLDPGLYRYLPLDHQLCFLHAQAELGDRMDDLWGWRRSLRESAIVFIWTAIPYRTAWRYGAIAPKIIALEAGHVCQNLYLACEAVGCGTCAIVDYNQKLLDGVLSVDGEQEFVVYLAPVGKAE